jgi:hypothetical protein
MPLDVMSSGFTPEEAEDALKEAVHLFILQFLADLPIFLMPSQY